MIHFRGGYIHRPQWTNWIDGFSYGTDYKYKICMVCHLKKLKKVKP